MRFFLLAFLMSASAPGWTEVTQDFSREIVVVTGLRKEARRARGENVSVIVSGANAERAATLLAARDFSKVEYIVSFGLAGALNPNYEPGDIVIPHTIKIGNRSIPTDVGLASHMVSQLLARRIPFRQGTLVGSDHLIRTPEEKQALRNITFGDLVDMESHVAALKAEEEGIPFVAFRVISDPSKRALPKASIKAVTKNGYINILPILASLARNPSQFPELRQAGRDSKRAFHSMSLCQGLFQ